MEISRDTKLLTGILLLTVPAFSTVAFTCSVCCAREMRAILKILSAKVSFVRACPRWSVGDSLADLRGAHRLNFRASVLGVDCSSRRTDRSNSHPGWLLPERCLSESDHAGQMDSVGVYWSRRPWGISPVPRCSAHSLSCELKK